MKKCASCNIIQSMEEFYLIRNKPISYCKTCKKVKDKKSYEKRVEKILYSKKIYYSLNKEKIKENVRKNRCREKDAIYRKNNPEKMKLKYKKAYLKIKQNKLAMIKERIRCCIKSAINRGYKKTSRTSEILGCSYEFLIKYLEDTFYKNYPGKELKWELVHIDHIFPISLAKNEDELIKLNHHTNLQLLSATDNIRKSNKVI